MVLFTGNFFGVTDFFNPDNLDKPVEEVSMFSLHHFALRL